LNDPEGIVLDEERPDNKFNEALQVLGTPLPEFQDFEGTFGEETPWELNEQSY
jgi:hypothetical protein